MKRFCCLINIFLFTLMGCSSTPTMPDGHTEYSIESECSQKSTLTTYFLPRGFQSLILSNRSKQLDCQAKEIEQLARQLDKPKSPDVSLSMYCKNGQSIRKVRALIDVRLPDIYHPKSASMAISNDDRLRKFLDEKMRGFFIESAQGNRFGPLIKTIGLKTSVDSIGVSSPSIESVGSQTQLDALDKILASGENGFFYPTPMIYTQKEIDKFTLSWPDATPLYFDHLEKAGFISVSRYAQLDAADASKIAIGYSGIFRIGSDFEVGSTKLKSLLPASGHPFSSLMRKYVPRPTVEWLKEKQISPDDFRYFGWQADQEDDEFKSCMECLGSKGDARFGTWPTYIRYFTKVMRHQTQNPQVFRYQVDLDTEGFCKYPVLVGAQEEDI